MQISTKAVKTNKRQKLNFHDMQSAKQSDQRGKQWKRTNKRQQWDSLEA